MKTMVEKNSWTMSVRDVPYTGEPLTVSGVWLDEETWRFLAVFANANSMIRLRSHVASFQPNHDEEAVMEQIGQPVPNVCLIDFDKNRRAATMLAEKIHTVWPGTSIFAVSSQSQPNAILEAMRCGCSEYLVKPIDRDQLANAVLRIGARRKEKPDQNRGQLLAFMGAKGGCGVTTLATQMSALLASTCGRKTLLFDLHPDFGDAALYLKLTKTRYHFFELLDNTDRLDADLLESFIVRHSSGLDLIPAPEGSVTNRDSAPQGALTQTLDFLRGRYEFIVADLPPSLNYDNLTMARECDQLYLVTVAEVSAVRNVVRELEYFVQNNIPKDKIRIVLNRHHKRNVISDAQIEKVIEQRIFWRVPNAYPQVVKTINEGDPIAQLANSEVTRSLESLASELGKKPGTETKKQASGILGLWNR
jgi:pilus assembly protein CpaE